MKFINLTPHAITVGKTRFPPSGEITRVASTTQEEGTIVAHADNKSELVSLVSVEWGEIEGLPEPKPETVFIVSGLVMAQTSRRDIVAPGELVRDEHGNVIGCKSLRTQPGGISVKRLARPEYACPMCLGDNAWIPCPTGGWWCETCY